MSEEPDAAVWQRFFRLHRDLPREAPGSDAATVRAFRALEGLPERPRILDIGCGPGRSSLVLARESGGLVVAVDTHRPFLDRLKAAAQAEGDGTPVVPVVASMTDLPFAAGSMDLIWSEGAVYIMGFAEGLEGWRPLLKPGGRLAVSELCWLTDTPPDEAAAFWQAAYPAMTTVAGNRARAAAAGYRLLDTVALPAEAWWDDYYTPLSRNIDALRGEAADDPVMAELIRETEREIDLFRRYGNAYGYVFYLLERTESRAGRSSDGAAPLEMRS